MIDFKFNVHPIAYAVANVVNIHLSEDCVRYPYELKTYPFYNGREKGILLTFGKLIDRQMLCIVFGEHRNSDNIFVDSWIMNRSINPPTVNDFSEEAYKERKFFKYDQIYDAAIYILKKLNINII
jgi:hypothetical protein